MGNEQTSCGCARGGGSNGPQLFFSCSGAADVCELSDRAVRKLSRDGLGKMFCLAIQQLLRCSAFLTLVFMVTVTSATATEQNTQIPVPGLVTMVDLGAKKCIPCKMMAPILEELDKEYKDRAAIVFIDVWENPDAGKEFGIRTIPTQIFYDADGKEVLRHEGFFEKEAIVAELQKLGVK